MAQASREKEHDAAAKFRVPRWLAFVAGLTGTILGLLSNLFSSEFRAALEASLRQFNPAILYVLVATVVSSGSTVLIYRWLARTRRKPLISEGVIEIRSDALPASANTDDSVVGRHLRYLEAERESEDLVVFLHGLGLDANDFRPYMAESRYHCAALTLYGFNAEERADEHYAPISLDMHLQLLKYALAKFRHNNPRKRMTVVGFSFGADVLLFLNEAAPDFVRSLRLHRAVLLDPNINRFTTTISSKIAQVDREQPLRQLVGILSSATSVVEFRYLCEYIYKITSKNFGQTQRHAREVVARWNHESNELFLDLMGRLARHTDGTHVVLSFNFEQLFNGVARRADHRGLDANSFECATFDHFELIGPNFLRDRLEGIL